MVFFHHAASLQFYNDIRHHHRTARIQDGLVYLGSLRLTSLQEGTPLWTDGSVVHFTAYGAGQPDDFLGSEDCTEIDDGSKDMFFLFLFCFLPSALTC